ncbi:hypothetical protein ANO14919_062810 [Xylariales sp. No.14919]|nr:hypothetical protein ANO14919_062810 [Xylariales sp. No.14919]
MLVLTTQSGTITATQIDVSIHLRTTTLSDNAGRGSISVSWDFNDSGRVTRATTVVPLYTPRRVIRFYRMRITIAVSAMLDRYAQTGLWHEY